jgi:hypothetical protein
MRVIGGGVEAGVLLSVEVKQSDCVTQLAGQYKGDVFERADDWRPLLGHDRVKQLLDVPVPGVPNETPTSYLSQSQSG